MKVIGRKAEKKILEKYYTSKNAEFLAIYGRRRVGKTFLIRNYFKDKGVFFEITGALNSDLKEQLENFHSEYVGLFHAEIDQGAPKSWREAFQRLKQSLEKISKEQKIILFFDELPWLSSPRSKFLSALDYAWNRHFSQMDNVLLIVSGSAASWMINHIVNNTGGLYGRLSAHLRLLPFTLAETEEYFKSREVNLTRKQICEIFMVTGGVPKYLSYVEKGLSSLQVIHSLCFTPQSPLLSEFHKLYSSLFKNSEVHLRVIRALAQNKRGVLRSVLIERSGLKDGGQATLVLKELEESGFVASLPEQGKEKKEAHYYLNDEYTLFYLKWIEPNKGELLNGVEKEYWIKKQSDPSWKSWAGFAFEGICLKHLGQIKKGLQIGGVSTSSSYWKEAKEGRKEVEIDLVIDRADQCLNLCEMKFVNDEFVITKSYAEQLRRKRSLFEERTRTKKAIFMTLITPFGAKENGYLQEMISHQLTLDTLFIT
ncbi:MAG: AAA family ATPase [Chlamydiales bacterium]|nr:AAA family ATPase [Chlamydiales bacterium]